MENKRKLAYSLVTVLCTSCATPMLAPPNPNFLNLSGTLESTESDIYANKYHRANLKLKEGFKSEVCTDFEELSKKENFPLREISLIKAIESCDWTIEKYISIWKETEISPWLKEDFHKKSLLIANKKNIRQWQSMHNYELSFFPKIKKEREAYIRTALQIAEDEQFQDQIDLFNERLIEVSPRFIVAPKDEELFSIARDFERAAEYPRALETYESILRNPKIELDEKIKTWKRITRVFKNMRKKELAHSSTHSFVKWINKNKALLEDRYLEELTSARSRWARSAWTLGDRKLAKKILNNSIRNKYATKEQTADIYYLLAAIAKEEKKYKSALVYLNKAIPLANEKTKQKVLWELAWIEYKSKNYKRSSKLFASLHEEYDDKSQYAYWLAKSLSREKKTQESIKTFEKTIEIAPMGYYGLMARKKLRLSLELKANNIEVSEDNLFEWLISLGEYDLSKNYLNQFIYKAKGKGKVQLLSKMHKAGNFQGSLKTYFNMGQDQREEVQIDYAAYIYPKPVIQTKYLNKSIDMNLVYSIIRQESAFNKDAKSFADAYGLMQIIPQRAKKLARKHRIPYRKVEDLYDVAINTGLGSHYLNDLMKLMKRMPMAIGSYNAGESAMKRWIKARFDGDIEVFIEDIPYKETRKYIKLVLRNYHIYRSLPVQNDKFIY